MVSPRLTVNSPTVVMSLPQTCTGVCSTTMSGPGDGAQRAVFDAGHPGHDGAIAEAQNQLGVHRELAARADDEAHDRRMLGAARHEIDQRRGAVVGLEMGLEHQRVRPVAARDRAPSAAARSASGRARACRAARQSRLPNRNAASTANRSSRRAKPARRSCNRRSARNLRSARTCADFGFGVHGMTAAARSGQEKSTTTLMSSGCCVERLRPLLDRHAARDQPGQPVLVGALQRVDGILIMLAVGIDAAEHRCRCRAPWCD